MPSASSALASLEALKASVGSIDVNKFLHELVKLAQQAIDTPEERKAVVDAVMGFYDANVSSHVPAMFRDKTRAFIQDEFSAALEAAAKVGA